MQKKVICLTGAGGYVGTQTVSLLLQKGYRVRAVDNFQKGDCDALLSYIDHPDFEFVYGDVTDLNQCHKFLDGVDGVIHLAAIVGFPACKRQPALSKAVNVDGTKNLLIARKNNIPFVFASTGSVYGVVENGLCTENTPLNYVSLYGEHKFLAETAVRNESNTISFRFATGFGTSPNMRINLLPNDLTYQAVKNNCITIFEADAKRTFIHVKDMARAFEWGFAQLSHKTNKYEVYNCGDDKLNWSKRELAEYIKVKTGCHVFYGEIAKDEDKRNYSVDHSRLNKAGFYTKYTMEEGIDSLIKSVKLLKVRSQYD